MNTTISIDKETRDKAAERAKEEKISVSAVIRILLTDYAEGKIQIGTRMSETVQGGAIEVDEETQNLMDEVINEWNKRA